MEPTTGTSMNMILCEPLIISGAGSCANGVVTEIVHAKNCPCLGCDNKRLRRRVDQLKSVFRSIRGLCTFAEVPR